MVHDLVLAGTSRYDHRSALLAMAFEKEEKDIL